MSDSRRVVYNPFSARCSRMLLHMGGKLSAEEVRKLIARVDL